MIFPGGVQGKQYGLLTAVIHRGAFSMTPSEPRSRGKDTAATARQSALSRSYVLRDYAVAKQGFTHRQVPLPTFILSLDNR